MPYPATILLLIALWGLSPLSPSALPTAARLSRVNVSRAAEADHLSQDTDITEANWQQHPKIKAVRSIVQSIDAEISKGRFKTSERNFEGCGEGYHTLLRKAVDEKGVVRRYETHGGTEDHALKFQQYYDASGRLRFAFIEGGAVNETLIENRIYFDETGKRLWEEHKLLKGPGYPGFSSFSDERLSMTGAAKSFAEGSPCPEIKPRPRRRSR